MFSITFTTITHGFEALVVSSLGPLSLLVENCVMCTFRTALDGENQTLPFLSIGSSIPAVLRTNYPVSRRANPSAASSDHTMSVDAVRHDAEGVNASLRECDDV